MGIWHYTVGVNMRSILRDRVIRPATTKVPANERPAVWFSTNAVWEPTANKMWKDIRGKIRLLTKEETAIRGKGLYRIEVSQEAAPYGPEEFHKLSGVSEAMWDGLCRSAPMMGSHVGQWRVSFAPVTLERWIAIERYERDGWRKLSDDELERLRRKSWWNKILALLWQKSS